MAGTCRNAATSPEHVRVLREQETRHPDTGTPTSRVNSFPPHTLLARGGREGLAKAGGYSNGTSNRQR